MLSEMTFLGRPTTLTPSFVFCSALRWGNTDLKDVVSEGFQREDIYISRHIKEIHHKWDTGNPVLLEITLSQEINKRVFKKWLIHQF